MVGETVTFVIPSSAAKAYQGLANKYSAIEPPTWALLLANAVRVEGYDPCILDFDADPCSDMEASDKIAATKSRLAVFVLYGQNPNSGTTMMIGATALAMQLKAAHPDIKIVFIGSHASAMPYETISSPFIDFVFINEGVYGLLDLLKTNLKDELDKVRGLVYKRNGDPRGLPMKGAPGEIVQTADMDRVMPGYAWDLIDFSKYRAHYWHNYFKDEGRTPFAAISTSLGCSFGCSFCMINIVNRQDNADHIDASHSRGMRFWSPEFILREIETLSAMGVQTLRLSDEMFFLNRR